MIKTFAHNIIHLKKVFLKPAQKTIMTELKQKRALLLPAMPF